MNVEKFSTKLKRILCLVLGILIFNSISTFAVENNENYFLTQKHILESQELYNFIICTTEVGIFPDISKLDKDRKKNLVILFYKLFDGKFYEYELKKYNNEEYSNKKLNLMKTYFVKYPHQKDAIYYSIGKTILNKTEDISKLQEKIQDKKFSPYYLYVYVDAPNYWEKNISTLKANTLLTDEMIQELASIGRFKKEKIIKIVTDINNNSQIKDKNKYLYNYLIAGSDAAVVKCNPSYFDDAAMLYDKRVMKKQKEAINYLENSKINFSSELDDSIKIRKLIYSKNFDIDKLTRDDTYTMQYFIFNQYYNKPCQKEYLIKKLLDKNINIINLAYIMVYVSIDEPMKSEIEKLFDKGIIDNSFLFENDCYIKISEANSIYEKLQQSNQLTEEALVKAIKKQVISNHKAEDRRKIIELWGGAIGIIFLCIYARYGLRQSINLEALQHYRKNDYCAREIPRSEPDEESDEELKALIKLLKPEPDCASGYSDRAEAKTRLGLYQQAIEDYNKAIELKPDCTSYYSDRAEAKTRLGLYQQAIEDYDKAIELKPDCTSYYYDRGCTKAKLGLHQEAIDDYTKAIELKPNCAEAYFNRGNAKYSLEKYVEAIEDYNKAIELKQDFYYYIARGKAKSALGLTEEGRKDYKYAKELNKDSWFDTLVSKILKK